MPQYAEESKGYATQEEGSYYEIQRHKKFRFCVDLDRLRHDSSRQGPASDFNGSQPTTQPAIIDYASISPFRISASIFPDSYPYSDRCPWRIGKLQSTGSHEKPICVEP